MKNLISAQTQKDILANNLQKLAHQKGKTQADMVRELGVAEATLRSWFSAEKYPRIDKIQMLADYFNVARSRLTEEWQIANNLERVIRTRSIPVLGAIACGEPILAEENIAEYREEFEDRLPSGELFYLQASGDSMEPTIPNRSYVLIRQQPRVEDGEIAAVLVNGDEEATLKRVKHQGNIVMLIADNTKYPPIIVNEDNPARIIGKAVKISIDL